MLPCRLGMERVRGEGRLRGWAGGAQRNGLEVITVLALGLGGQFRI